MHLVSKVLEGDNYGHWSRAITVALSAKKKLGFILGTCKRPEESLVLQEQWDTCNSMVISWLLNALKPEIAESVMYAATAENIWVDLKQRYGQLSRAKIFQLQRDLCSVSQGSQSISTYFTHIKKLWDEYHTLIVLPPCVCGASEAQDKIQQTQQLMQFLMGLNKDYTTVRGNLLLMNPLPNINQAYSLLLEEERQRGIHPSAVISNESSALAATHSQKKFQYRQDSNQGTGMNSNTKRSNLQCAHCKMTGHTMEKCYKLHGYPPGHKLYKGKNQGNQAYAH
ncbi:hypothetical protein Ancab_040146 [Ancistrocladus abbreviatus]